MPNRRNVAALIEEFVSIVDALNREGIDYAVCGGWAMAIHGRLRATIDIDLLILAADLDPAMRVARELGFDIEGLPLNFDGGRTQIRRISKVDRASKELITLDLILVTPVYESAWRTRRLVTWERGEYRVVDVEGMIIMKELAGRPKDLEDLKFLRGENGGS